MEKIVISVQILHFGSCCMVLPSKAQLLKLDLSDCHTICKVTVRLMKEFYPFVNSYEIVIHLTW